MNQTSKYPANARVIIVGGGIAGISAAMGIAETMPQVRLTVLEARRNTGGRAGSFADPVTSEVVDYCQHVAMGCCTNLLDLLDRTGMKSDFNRYPSLTFYHPNHGMSQFKPNLRLPAPLHLNGALAGLSYLQWQDRNRIGWAIMKLMRQSEHSLAGLTAAEWLDRHRQSMKLRERFWDVVLISALGDVPERVSMSAARKVIVDGFAGSHGASDVWVPKRPLSEIFGEPMLECLSGVGAEVITGYPVRSIRWDPESKAVTLVRDDGASMQADHVVLATAWRGAARLIETMDNGKDAAASDWTNSTLRFLSSIQPSPITGLHLWFDRELTPLPHVVMVGTVSHWLFKQPLQESSTDRRGIYHQVVISGRHAFSEASKEELLAVVMSELATAFPDTFTGDHPVNLLHHRIVTDPNAVYSVTPEFQAERPNPTTPIDWLTLAGDYVQTGWPATMEGAVISGRLAVDAFAQRYHGQVEAKPTCVTPAMVRGGLAKWLIR